MDVLYSTESRALDPYRCAIEVYRAFFSEPAYFKNVSVVHAYVVADSTR